MHNITVLLWNILYLT